METVIENTPINIIIQNTLPFCDKLNHLRQISK
jgi:hypothetical protein